MVNLNPSLEAFKPQEIHTDLPPFPASAGPTLAREIRSRHLVALATLADDAKAALGEAEEALLTVVEQQEARTERRDRLQAFASKKSGPTIGGSISGARR
ncbi:hypothetical protein [Rathayibacter sp. VKM Ac-2754]|uniref:hypothetical protein n=1 Tax=Rathayibacter sp. VKM Ac-2754 TaxID=2609251 RepID=UPI001358689D|nr:hypothetical protein [Rathayibacter sp. VKM Ac-2754]MWV57431.1 hypothetical protein [Rathayibacter sp. VKM Ac-2754]